MYGRAEKNMDWLRGILIMFTTAIGVFVVSGFLKPKGKTSSEREVARFWQCLKVVKRMEG